MGICSVYGALFQNWLNLVGKEEEISTNEDNAQTSPNVKVVLSRGSRSTVFVTTLLNMSSSLVHWDVDEIDRSNLSLDSHINAHQF